MPIITLLSKGNSVNDLLISNALFHKSIPGLHHIFCNIICNVKVRSIVQLRNCITHESTLPVAWLFAARGIGVEIPLQVVCDRELDHTPELKLVFTIRNNPYDTGSPPAICQLNPLEFTSSKNVSLIKP